MTNPIKHMIRRAIENGQIGTDRDGAERQGLADKLTEQGVKLVDAKELSASQPEDTLVVCAPLGTATPYTDNCEGRCIECARPIIYRPIFSADVPKICTFCVLDMA